MRRKTLRAYTYAAYFTFTAILLILYKLKMDTKLYEKFHKWNSTSVKRLIPTQTLPQQLKLRYILQWTSPKNSPFVYMGMGQKGFIFRNCTYTNCFVTSNKTFLKNITEYDVIAFAGPEVIFLTTGDLPERRSPHQKYVFANIESADYYPLCTSYFDGYFNWTWTYRLDSDMRWGYVVIKDIAGRVIGPNKIMHWRKRENMLPASDELKMILRGKTRAAAWFVSNCKTANNREKYAFKLDQILQSKYNLSVDIYGACGKYECPRTNENVCNDKIKKDYYFYLSFENSFSEDYVTEKLLIAVQNNAVPIVYGGANYSRFMPDGSYLNAKELSAEEIAAKLYELINNFEEYVQFFRWTNHYSFHRMSESAETNEYCNMCEILNDERKTKVLSVHTELRKWWDPPDALCYENHINVNI